MTKFIGVIPARMGSSRFPGKPLADILGKTMIEHVYMRSKLCSDLSDVFVATCDEEIAEEVRRFNGKVVMTSPLHERCTDRVAEAIQGVEADIVVVIQGDEPMLHPEMITQAINALKNDPDVFAVNLMQLCSREEANDPNEVKVVVNRNGDAIYFSREPIPSDKKYQAEFPIYKQVCIMPFTVNSLIKFNKMAQTPLEKIESVDMLRIVENGLRVKMVFTDYVTYSVDTMEDLEKVSILMKD